MTSATTTEPRAVIFGVAGPELSDRERALFAEADPLGFILFARNCVSPDQVRRLVGDLRESVGREDAPVLIDQEGGRVQRMGPPHWRAAPPAASFAKLAGTDEASALEAAWLNARLLAAELADLGISVDCAPVLDIPQPGAHDIIGDRAAGTTPADAAMFGRVICSGLLAGGVLPVIKHMPGHGRATADSHVSLPVVHDPREALEQVDFAPFHALNGMPWGMTAHVIYTALDDARPGTISPTVINDVIRGAIGFHGVLLSDDLSMGALGGPLDQRALAALSAGCDVALHCNGDFEEMEAVAAVCPTVTRETRDRLAKAEAIRCAPEPFDIDDAKDRVAAFLGRMAT